MLVPLKDVAPELRINGGSIDAMLEKLDASDGRSGSTVTNLGHDPRAKKKRSEELIFAALPIKRNLDDEF